MPCSCFKRRMCTERARRDPTADVGNSREPWKESMIERENVQMVLTKQNWKGKAPSHPDLCPRSTLCQASNNTVQHLQPYKEDPPEHTQLTLPIFFIHKFRPQRPEKTSKVNNIVPNNFQDTATDYQLNQNIMSPRGVAAISQYIY